MDYRALRIFVWLAAAALLALFVIGSSATPATRRHVQPSFRIVTANVSDVMTEDVTPEIAETLHLNRTQGVLVTDILYSPLQPGDVILSINGNPVRCQRELDAQLGELGSEQTFTIGILRNNSIQTVPVQRAMETPPPSTILEGTGEARGISVASLSSESGVLVANVQIGTAASDLGLKDGDIILEVDGHRVHSAVEFLEFMRQLGNRRATLNVRQRNGQVNVFVIPA